MKVNPVFRYNTPGYPLKEETSKNPALLLKLPDRWKHMAGVCTAVSALTISLMTSCAAPITTPEYDHVITAGVIVAPSTTLTEEEAINIILEETRKYGLSFSHDYEKKIDVNIPTDTSLTETVLKTVTLDGFDPDKKAGFEYVSQVDAYNAGVRLEVPALASVLNSEFQNHSADIKVKAFYTYNDTSMEEAAENLRNQVMEFIYWLKAEGII